MQLKPPELKRIQLTEDAWVDLCPLLWGELEDLRHTSRDKDGRPSSRLFASRTLEKAIRGFGGFTDVHGKNLSMAHLSTVIELLPEVHVARLVLEAQSHGLQADTLLGNSREPSRDSLASEGATDGAKSTS